MCGITGGFIQDITKGVEAIRHRGPDAEGQISVGEISLGNTRLAIKDLDARSNQPFTYGSVRLVYNGEIWNYTDIRQELEAEGYEFTTEGDTEVLAAALEAWDINTALAKINGMFAFAFTKDGSTLFIARDRFGEIPVHIGKREDESLLFASEIKALQTLDAVPNSIIYVPPGNYVKATKTNTSMECWYVPPIIPSLMEAEECPQKLFELLKNAVHEREMSDVPICTMLSGGLDSSIITYLLSLDIPDIVAYTAVYDSNSRDLRMARMLAEQLGIELREVKVELPTEDDLRDVINIAETHFKVQVEIGWACLQLAKAMKRDGFKVTFSGDGSDELFASYGFSFYGIKKDGWYPYRRRLFLDQSRKNFSRANKIFMSQGIECRLPFLNPKVVEFILSMPQNIAQQKGKPKALLQAAFDGKLPDGIVYRPKVAFQDGMGIKADISKVLDNPSSFYRNEYYNFRVGK